MNSYGVARCNKCNQTVVFHGSFTVHGAENIKKLAELLIKGISFSSAAQYFCGGCGEFTSTPGKCTCHVGYMRQYYEEA